MKVLVISSYGGLGGAELALTSFLGERPPGVEAEALLVSGGALEERLRDLGIPVRAATGFEGRPGPARVARFNALAWREIGRVRPDVVWAIGQKATLLAGAAARLRRTPLVWHKVDFSWDRRLGVPLALLSSGAIGVSEAVLEALGPLRERRRLGTVGPPIPLPDDLRAHPDPARPVIGTLGRLVPYKGHHHLVRAAALLSDDFPGLRVVLAGVPEPQYPGYRESLVDLGRELGLGDRLELPGFVPPAAVLERLSVFVNATFRDEEGFGFEGLSGAMLEASWAGIPVVATLGGGTAEGVVDGQTGTLVAQADPQLLAEAIRPYLIDPELAARTGDAGARFARERFAPPVVAARLFELLAVAAR
jgi:glycosyltransferase involved in cell wall biosynthesis